MIVAVDIDDVLADSVTALLEYYNDNYSAEITRRDLDRFGYWGFLGETREEANKKYFEFTDSHYFDLTKPMSGARVAITKISRKHEVILITGRPLFLKQKTEEWVEKYFPGLFSGVYFTNDRLNKNDHSAYWGRSKAEICDEIGAEVLVDDLFEYLEGSDHLSVILFNQPWNQGETKKHIKRVNGWDKIVRLLS